MSDAGEAGEEDGWKEVQGRNPAGKGVRLVVDHAGVAFTCFLGCL